MHIYMGPWETAYLTHTSYYKNPETLLLQVKLSVYHRPVVKGEAGGKTISKFSQLPKTI